MHKMIQLNLCIILESIPFLTLQVYKNEARPYTDNESCQSNFVRVNRPGDSAPIWVVQMLEA